MTIGYFIEIFMLAVGLSMDSLAVSTASGVMLKKFCVHCVLKIAAYMAAFQAGLTFAGFLVGGTFSKYITHYDHWIAFILLLYLGGKMIYEGLAKKDDNDNCRIDPMNDKILCGMSLATSIDALAVGVSMALLDSPILMPVATIGIVTFAFSAFGVYFGHHFSGKTRINLNVLGGIILIAIGCKILIEHLYC